MKKFTTYKQLDQMDCGPTCLKMIAQYYGKYVSLHSLRQFTHITREGVSLKGINEAAEKLGFRTLAAKISIDQLIEDAILPSVLHWNQNHFVVLVPQDLKKNLKNNRVLIADPRHGLIKISKDLLISSWMSNAGFGVILLMEPTPLFYEMNDEIKSITNFSFIFRYLIPYKKHIFQIFMGMFFGSILALILPFLTQSLVDYGINHNNIDFIYLILVSQLAVFAGSLSIEIIRGWLLLHISTRVNIAIISDFLIKLMKLPIRFFDTKMVGDITQRIQDHNRIEQFLTGASLNTMFSMMNIIVFSIVLWIYSFSILGVFLLGSTLSIFWITYFLKRRSELDYARFQHMSNNQNSLFEIVTGMQEIKMNDSETTHRWEWENIQAKLFKISTKSLSLEQTQKMGSEFFTQLKNILITFIAARQVMNGTISIGMMLSISYITGQMNSPIQQLLSFFRSAQDAKISLERLNEIHSLEEEEKPEDVIPDLGEEMSDILDSAIILKDVSFQYSGPSSPKVLANINAKIPLGKVTAIVGGSGSGKTTLMKLLLKFYEPTEGEILLNDSPFKNMSAKEWRKLCGVVMAEGYIFSNTIERNITVQQETDVKRLNQAIEVANINSFIKSLPLGLSTKIGNTGNGISSGQRQRLLIARAIYKNPRCIFLDEATNSLDANNEKTIIENLGKFFISRTVIVIAHRLSTVRNADNIIVMENGKIVESGNHKQLIENRDKYYELIKNQLELGN